MKPFVRGTRTHIDTQTMCDKEKLSEALSTPRRPLCPLWNINPYTADHSGDVWGRCAGTDGEVVTQAD